MISSNDVETSSSPPSQELDDFRQNWHREIAQNVLNTPVENSNSNKENESVNEDQQEIAENLFQKAVEFERKGKVYDALPFYKKAVQMMPDIERIFYEKLNFATSVQENEGQKIVESSSSDSLEWTNDLDLYEKFQEDLSTDGQLIHSSIDENVISTKTHISELPGEIIFYILRWVVSNQLDLASLENCARVSKGMYLYARDDELWRSACIQVWGDNVGTPKQPGSNKEIHYTSWRQMYIERPRVLYNGCYISKTTYLRMGENSFQDQYYRPIQLVEYFRYIRFLPDGTMFMMTSADEPSLGVTKLRYVHNLRPEILRGHYCLQGNLITCWLRKQQSQQRIPYSVRSRRDSIGAYSDESGSNKYRIEFQILSTSKRKFCQLIWQHYSITQIRNKIESSSVFDLVASKYPPLWFSPVRSYHLITEAPLT